MSPRGEGEREMSNLATLDTNTLRDLEEGVGASLSVAKDPHGDDAHDTAPDQVKPSWEGREPLRAAWQKVETLP